MTGHGLAPSKRVASNEAPFDAETGTAGRPDHLGSFRSLMERTYPLAQSDLSRFVDAQRGMFETALAEIASGRKRSHWMWFIFPQLRGLGHSAMAQHYGIASSNEAREYLAHPLLGTRYRECVAALNRLASADAVDVFGATDAMKLRSSLTLFDAAEPSAMLREALERFFNGERDEATLRILSRGEAR